MQELIDQLLDMGLTHSQVKDVLEWHYDLIAHEREAAGGAVVIRLLGFILGRPKESRVASTRLRALGLAFAGGLNQLTGYKTLTEAAQAEGCSTKALSLVAAEAGAELNLPLGPNRKKMPPYKESFACGPWPQ
jgi:hypothetical protein